MDCAWRKPRSSKPRVCSSLPQSRLSLPRAPSNSSMREMEADGPHPTLLTRHSLPPQRSSGPLLKEKRNARKIRIRRVRSLGSPGLLPAWADGIATTSHPVQRPCEPAGPGSPQWPKAIPLLWLLKMSESRRLAGRGRRGAVPDAIALCLGGLAGSLKPLAGALRGDHVYAARAETARAIMIIDLSGKT